MERSHIPILHVVRPKRARTRIPAVSKRRQREGVIYRKLVKEFIAAHPHCEWWLAEEGFATSDIMPNGFVARFGVMIRHTKVPPSKEVHHKKGRGRFYLDTSTWMAVSAEGHRQIHADPKRSYERGYMLPRR